MLILSAQRHIKIKDYDYNYVGRLFIPDLCSGHEETIESGMLYAADNGCFSGFKEKKFFNMLERLRDADNCLFITAPDVVADHKETLKLYKQYIHKLKEYNLPIAFVLQDGSNTKNIPLNEIDAVFIGGTTEWKLGKMAREITYKAKELNKWVHMGRVNSYKRLNYAISIGVDSVDGMKYSKFSDTFMNDTIEFLRQGKLEISGNRIQEASKS